MEFDFQIILGILGAIIGIYGSLIYILSILKRDTRPHFFTYLIWAIITWIGFFAQITDNPGAGMWVMLITAVSTSFISILSLKFGTKDIKKSDWFFLILSLSAIIPWMITDNPFWSVIMICFIDAVAMIPTIRKSWDDPWGENLQSYNMANIKFILSIIALSNVSVITAAYPVAVIIINFSLVFVCLYRRRFIAKPI